jgi:hypothetical protein
VRAGGRRAGADRCGARAAPTLVDGDGVPTHERRVRATAVRCGARHAISIGRARCGWFVLGDEDAAGAAHKCTFVLRSSARCPSPIPLFSVPLNWVVELPRGPDGLPSFVLPVCNLAR